jgi:hypothetical protein
MTNTVRQPRFRFTLRTLLLLTGIIAFALWAVPASIEWYKWRLIRAVVIDTMDQIAASPGKPSIYMGVAWHSVYCLANVEVKWDLSTNSGTQVSSTPRNDAVFVEMPGKVHQWAHTPDEVMQLIRDND